MPITTAAIIDWMDWAAARHLSDCTVTVDGYRITLRRDQAAPRPSPMPETAPPADTDTDADTDADAIRAPLAGICHLGPEPGGTPFVSPGTRVEPGQTICIIEAMKLMTAIPAPHAGTVTAILARDGETIPAGAPLMRIG